MRWFLQFFFSSSAIISVSVFYVWPKTILLLPMWPREAKRLDTPALDVVVTNEDETIIFSNWLLLLHRNAKHQNFCFEI